MSTQYMTTAEENYTATLHGYSVKDKSADYTWNDSFSSLPSIERKNLQQKVLRKFKGFFDHFDGNNAVVYFVVDDEPIEYAVPANLLKKNRINRDGQPFEYIEMEVYDSQNKTCQMVTQYRPLCSAEDCDRRPIEFDSETRQRLNDLLKKNDSI